MKKAEPNKSNIVMVIKMTLGPLSTREKQQKTSYNELTMEKDGYMRTRSCFSGYPAKDGLDGEQEEERPSDTGQEDVEGSQAAAGVDKGNAEGKKGPADWK